MICAPIYLVKSCESWHREGKWSILGYGYSCKDDPEFSLGPPDTHRYLFDIIGELYLGKQFGFMKEEGDYGGYIESQHLFVATVSWAAFLPSYAQGPLMLTGLILPSTRKAFAALGRLEKLAIDCVTERQHHLREGSSRRQDHLAKVLAIHNERGEKVNFILEDVYMEAFIALYCPLPLSNRLKHIS